MSDVKVRIVNRAISNELSIASADCNMFIVLYC